jgi:hypothetical protein
VSPPVDDADENDRIDGTVVSVWDRSVQNQIGPDDQYPHAGLDVVTSPAEPGIGDERRDFGFDLGANPIRRGRIIAGDREINVDQVEFGARSSDQIRRHSSPLFPG